jgi:hypothetical protein
VPASLLRPLVALLVALTLAAPEVRAAPGAGTLDDPVVIDGFPWAMAGDTAGHASAIDAYACAPDLDESCPEVVFRLEITFLETILIRLLPLLRRGRDPRSA